MGRVIAPFHQGIGLVMEAAVWIDANDEFFDMTATLEQFPLELTDLEDWIRDDVAIYQASLTNSAGVQTASMSARTNG